MAIQFNLNPVHPKQNLFSVTDVTNQLTAFNDAFHAVQGYLDSGDATLGSGYAWDTGELANWRRDFRDGVVNVGGRPSDINFFINMMGGSPKTCKATDLTIKYNNYTDFCITALADGTYVAAPSTLAGARWGNVTTTATYTGPYASFQISQSDYSNGGTYANIEVGQSIMLLNEGKNVQVIKIDKTNAYAWIIYVAPYDQDYVINIQAGQRLLPQATYNTSGYSDADIVRASAVWKQQGYFKVIQPFMVEQAWECPYELAMPYQDVMQFPLLFDIHTGATIDTFDFMAANDARIMHTIDKNVKMWCGEKLKNTYMSAGANGGFYTTKYGGFDGLMNTIWYGGGHIRPVDPTYGFDPDVDYTQIIIESDALKLTTEYMFLVAKQFNLAMLRNFNTQWKSGSGSQTFSSFARSGFSGEDIRKYEVSTYEFSGSTLHIKEVSAWSDKRFIGNGPFPNMGLMMPSYGTTDSNGQQVDPIELYQPEGRTLSGTYTETWRNDFLSEGRKKRWSGNVEELLMMAAHNIENMYAMMPTIATS